jgi:hypothetical protein
LSVIESRLNHRCETLKTSARDLASILYFLLFQVEQTKSNNIQQTPPADNSPATTSTGTSSSHQRHNKHHHGKHVLVSSTSKQ